MISLDAGSLLCNRYAEIGGHGVPFGSGSFILLFQVFSHFSFVDGPTCVRPQRRDRGQPLLHALMRIAATLRLVLSRLCLGARGSCVEQLAGRPVLGLERLSHDIAPSEPPARTAAIVARPIPPVKRASRNPLLQCETLFSLRHGHVRTAGTKDSNRHGLKLILLAQIKDQNAKRTIVESRHAGTEFKNSQKKLSAFICVHLWPLN